MKLALVLYLFVAFFGAGLLFFRLQDHFTEQKFSLTLSRAAGCVWVSVGLSLLTRLVHRQGMLLREHLIFDALGTLFWAVMLACGIAFIQELRAHRGAKQSFGPNVRPFPAPQGRKMPFRGEKNKCLASGKRGKRAV